MTKTSKYTYQKLSEIKEPNKEYNFYALVIDATFPHSEDYPSSFVCILKVIDETSNFVDGLAEKDIYTVIVKASEKNQTPFIHNVGDIIRIHRGYFRPKTTNNIYCNLTKENKVKSSWCHFPALAGNNPYEPLVVSSSNYSISESDHKTLDDLRAFSADYFVKKNALSYNYVCQLDDRTTQNYDYDLFVYVRQATIKTGVVELQIEDKTEKCELYIDAHFSMIKQDDVLRIRHASNFNDRTILLNNYSNILRLPPTSHLAKQLVGELKGVKKAKKSSLAKLPLQGYSIGNLLGLKDIVAETSSTNLPLREYSSLKVTDRKVNMILKVVEVTLENQKEAVKVLNKTTGKIENLTKSKKLEADEKLIYAFTLICEESPFSTELIKVQINTRDNEGQSLFDNTLPCNFHDAANSSDFNKFKNSIEFLKEKGKYIKASVEINRQADEQILRLIGIYSFNK